MHGNVPVQFLGVAATSPPYPTNKHSEDTMTRFPLLFHVLVVVASLSAFPNSVRAQAYSSDLKDIFAMSMGGKEIFDEVGDLGKIQTIAAVRGFMPILCKSKKRIKENGLTFFGNDDYLTYKFPLTLTLKEMYYGMDELWQYHPRTAWGTPKAAAHQKKTFQELLKQRNARAYFDKIDVINEKDAKGEDLAWIKFAYALTSGKAGEKMYGHILGGRGYKSAEPVAIIFTENDALVFSSLRWESSFGTPGQTIVAFEISRNLNKFRTFHRVFDTSDIKKSVADAAREMGPTVAEIAKTIFVKN